MSGTDAVTRAFDVVFVVLGAGGLVVGVRTLVTGRTAVPWLRGQIRRPRWWGAWSLCWAVLLLTQLSVFHDWFAAHDWALTARVVLALASAVAILFAGPVRRRSRHRRTR
ncbi:hypothetical protein [Streptomyces sp. VRA16 Mangrove soil]|uniref:hypothetical protein n=1 Tax=Streptomyces sp. VRA16 Mangrove soil TaxID=2817434 RepID=UPI001A9F7AB5|nr:hypothetical protein [Streptomyces sp. VRA16 Mangrove soil]MBO1334037.1 hypothetical protein [Streptomyces sp. VRA16 Mangrove soil]